MNKQFIHRAIGIVASAAAIAGALSLPTAALADGGPHDGGVGVASATSERNGRCEHDDDSGFGEICLWYRADYRGSRIDLFFADDNLTNDRFLTAGAGRGRVVASNVRSLQNEDHVYYAVLYPGRHRTGDPFLVGPGAQWDDTTGMRVRSLGWASEG